MSRPSFLELTELNRMRRCAARVWMSAEVLAGSEGWSVGPLDPGDMLPCFARLKTVSDLRLVAFQYREEASGHGQVLALPADADPTLLLDAFRAGSVSESNTRHAMSAFTGDGSPESYVQASILSRELGEWGAYGEGCRWLDRSLVDDSVLRGDTVCREPDGSPSQRLPEQWVWSGGRPSSMAPIVWEREGRIVVEYYSFGFRRGQTLWRHRDQFRAGIYVPEPDDELVAMS